MGRCFFFEYYNINLVACLFDIKKENNYTHLAFRNKFNNIHSPTSSIIVLGEAFIKKEKADEIVNQLLFFVFSS